MKKINQIRLYKFIALIVAAVLLYYLAAFSNMPDADERSIVTMMGVDAADDGGGVTVTAHILVPVSGGDNKFNQDTEQAEGKDLLDAINKFGVMNGRKVEFSKCAVLVFGQTMAERGILRETKTLLGSRLVSPGTLMILTDGTTAREFLKTALDLGEETGENIGKLLNRFENTLAMPYLNLLTFLDGHSGESRAAFMPCVELRYKDGADKTDGEAAGGGDGRKPKLNSKADIFSVNAAAVFREGKFVRKLTPDATQGLIFTMPESKRGNYSIDGFSYGGRHFDAVYAEVPKKSARIKTYFEDGKPKIRCDVRMKISLTAQHDFSYLFDENPAAQNGIYAAISEEFQKKIKLQIESAVLAAREGDIDFMNLKYRFYRYNPQAVLAYEQNTDNAFLRDLTVETRVYIGIRN